MENTDYGNIHPLRRGQEAALDLCCIPKFIMGYKWKLLSLIIAFMQDIEMENKERWQHPKEVFHADTIWEKGNENPGKSY